MPPYFFQKGFSVLGGFDDAALTGAALPLSAARFPQVAAAVAEIPDFQPVIAEKQMNLGGPGEGGFKVGENIPEIGPAPMHRIPSLSLAWSEGRDPR
jgi:hypothetical protein